jgi:hypothetical protein
MANEATLEHPAGELNETDKAFLDAAQRLFTRNVDWFEFEGFAFGMRSPLFAKNRSHKNILEDPLYRALTEMWIQLGIRQGRVRDDSRGSEEGSR